MNDEIIAFAYRLAHDVAIENPKLEQRALTLMKMIDLSLEPKGSAHSVFHGPNIKCRYAGEHHVLLCNLVDSKLKNAQAEKP